MKRVLVTDYTWASTEPEAEVLARVPAALVVAETGEEAELVELVRDADAILTCFAQVTAAVVRAGEKLQVIGRYGIGVDNIAVAQATELGIPVTNVPGYCVHEVAEHALALSLSLARGVVAYDRGVREGDWTLARAAPLHRVAGRRLGIVGRGQIGRALAAKAAGLGLEVEFQERGRPLEQLAARADVLSLHLPLTPETRGLVGEGVLRAMKPTAFLVNTARAALVDQDALARALREGWIAGAGVDVFDPERLPADHPLLAAPNLVATPHVAFYSEQSVRDLELLAAENVARVLEGRRPAALVNPEVLELERWSHLS